MISTIVFGNGIGMALDSNHFNLRAGLTSAWDSFFKDEKRLISLGSNTMPSSEKEPERHHVVMTACKNLKAQESDIMASLSNDGKNFPDLYQNYIYKAAKHCYQDGGVSLRL